MIWPPPSALPRQRADVNHSIQESGDRFREMPESGFLTWNSVRR
jgi:hypothetical protein